MADTECWIHEAQQAWSVALTASAVAELPVSSSARLRLSPALSPAIGLQQTKVTRVSTRYRNSQANSNLAAKDGHAGDKPSS